MFISCWHESDRESAAMWKLYAREHDGAAIKTDFRSLRDSLTGSEPVHIGRVSYIDYQNTLINEGNAFDPYLCKRQEFEHEREVRAISLGPVFSGMYHTVDLRTLIKNVVIAPYAEDWFDKLVRSVASRYGLGDYVTRSSLAETPSW